MLTLRQYKILKKVMTTLRGFGPLWGPQGAPEWCDSPSFPDPQIMLPYISVDAIKVLVVSIGYRFGFREHIRRVAER